MGPNERALLEALQGADDTDPTALAAAGPFAALGGLAAVRDTHWSGVGQEVDDTRTELGPVVSDVRGGTVLGATPASAMVASIERAAADLAARVEALTTGADAEATAGWALFAARAAYRGEGEPAPAPRATPVPAGTPPEERIATALADSQARQAHEQALAAREARMAQILATLTAELAASRDTFAAINAESGRDGGGDGGTSQHDAPGSGGRTVPAGGAGAVVPAAAHVEGSRDALPHPGDPAASQPHGLVLASPAPVSDGDAGAAAGADFPLGGGLATGIGAAAGAAALGAGAVVAARRALGGLAARGATGPVGSASSATRTTDRSTPRPGVLGAPATATSNASRTANSAARPAGTGGTRGSGPLAAGHSASNAAGGRRGRRTDRDRDTDRVHYPGDGDWLDDQPSGPAVLR